MRTLLTAAAYVLMQELRLRGRGHVVCASPGQHLARAPVLSSARGFSVPHAGSLSICPITHRGARSGVVLPAHSARYRLDCDTTANFIGDVGSSGPTSDHCALTAAIIVHPSLQ